MVTLTVGSTSGIPMAGLTRIVESDSQPRVITFKYGDGTSIVITAADYIGGVQDLLRLRQALGSFFSSAAPTLPIG
jgi:hypothetical protein